MVAGLGSWGFPPHLPLCAVLQEEVRQAVTPAEPVQYYFTLAQQPAAVQVQGQQQGQQTTTSTTTIQPGQIIIAQPQQGQVSVGRARGCAACWGPLAHLQAVSCSHCCQQSVVL